MTDQAEPQGGAESPRASPATPSRRVRWPTAAAVLGGALAVYCLVSWDYLSGPSPQFHFVDLAHSLMQGRLDTDTPKQRKASRPKPDDPPGYRAAIERTLDTGGWNDWAGVRVLTLAHPAVLDDGSELSVVRGRFPWLGSKDPKLANLFHTADGLELRIDLSRDLARTCGPNGRRRCDERKHYVSFPPMPAVLMMPAAAVWGYDTNDVLITCVVAAFNALLFFLLLELLVRRGHSRRSRRDNLWLTALFAFGTVIFFSSVRGEVWFTALIFGLSFNLLYILAALDTRHPILAGLMIGLGTATRVPIAFCFVFFAWQLFFPGGRWSRANTRQILIRGTLFAVPILVCAAGLLWYNDARFGSATEFGHSFLSGGAATKIRDHGMFSGWYLNGNLSAALTNLPRVTLQEPYLEISRHGLGLPFTTPVLLLLLWPRRRPPVVTAMWLAVAAAAIPGLLYQNSGWQQFGYRFAIDYLPYLFALLAIGGRPLTWKVKVFIGISILINLFGAMSFQRWDMYYG